MKKFLFPVLFLLFSTACLFAQPGGTRDLPATYTPGGTVTVNLTITEANMVTEGLPAGWTIISSTPNWSKHRPSLNTYEWIKANPSDLDIVYTVSVPADAEGTYTFWGNVNDTIPIEGDIEIQEETAIPGDINGDGDVNISDVILCLRVSIGLAVTVEEVEYIAPDYSAYILAAADMNTDGDVNISDVILILRKSIELD